MPHRNKRVLLHQDSVTTGRPSPDGQDRQEVRHRCRTWAEVCHVVRTLSRQGQIDNWGILSFSEALAGQRPNYEPVTSGGLQRWRDHAMICWSSAVRFRLEIHDSTETRSTEDQRPFRHLTVTWLARGQRLEDLTDARNAHAS